MKVLKVLILAWVFMKGYTQSQMDDTRFAAPPAHSPDSFSLAESQ